MKMNLSVVMETVDKMSQPLKQMRGAQGQLNEKIQQAQQALKKHTEAMANIGEFKKLGAETGALTKKINQQNQKLQELDEKLTKAKDSHSSVSKEIQEHKDKLKQLGSVESKRTKTLADIAELEKQLASAKDSGKADQAKAIQAALKEQKQSLSALNKTEKERLQTIKKLDRLNAKYERSSKSIDRITGRAVEQKRVISDLNATKSDQVKTIVKLKNKLKSQKVDVSRLSSEQKRLNKAYESTSKEIKAITGRYEKLQKFKGIFAKGFAKGVKGAAVGFAGLTAAGAGLLSTLHGSAEEVSILSRNAKNLKMDMTDIQAIKFQAGNFGLDPDAMDDVLYDFSEKFGEMQGFQSGALNDWFEDRKSPLYKELIAAKDASQAYKIVLKQLSMLENQQDKMFLANEAFGENGKQMLAMLEQGQDGLTKAKAEFIALGGGVTNEEAQAADEYKVALNKITTAFNAMKLKIMTPFIQELTGAMTELTEKFKSADWREQAIAETIEAIKGLFSAIKSVGKGLIFLKNWFPEIIAGLAMLKIGFFALNAVMLANPIGLIVAAVAGLVVGLTYLITKFVPLNAMFKSLKQLGAELWAGLKATGNGIIEIGKQVWTFFSRIGSGIVGITIKATSALLAIPKAILSMISMIPESLLPDGWADSIDKMQAKVKSFEALGDKKIDFALNGEQNQVIKQTVDLVRGENLPAQKLPAGQQLIEMQQGALPEQPQPNPIKQAVDLVRGETLPAQKLPAGQQLIEMQQGALPEQPQPNPIKQMVELVRGENLPAQKLPAGKQLIEMQQGALPEQPQPNPIKQMVELVRGENLPAQKLPAGQQLIEMQQGTLPEQPQPNPIKQAVDLVRGNESMTDPQLKPLQQTVNMVKQTAQTTLEPIKQTVEMAKIQTNLTLEPLKQKIQWISKDSPIADLQKQTAQLDMPQRDGQVITNRQEAINKQVVDSSVMLKSPMVQSKSEVQLRIKSDRPVAIEQVTTDKGTDIDVDTGNLLGMAF